MNPRQAVLVRISHTRNDKRLAEALVNLLGSGLGLTPNQVACSNVDEYSEVAGRDPAAIVRTEIGAATLLIGLITPSCLSSPNVLFEVGVRVGAGLPVIPLFAGITKDEFRGPLSILDEASCSSDAHLDLVLRAIGEQLMLTVRRPAIYLDHAGAVRALADNLSLSAKVLEEPQEPPLRAGRTSDLQISFKIDGTPPSPQIIKVRANQPVTISLLEYLLPDERCIASQECSLEGETVDVPLSEECITEFYSAPRPDGSTYESAVKFRITASAGGTVRTYTFRAHMGAIVAGGTVFRRVIGPKDFVSGT